MKKRNVIVVGLLSLSLLAGCTSNKIERSQQDIKQEKVEKAKKRLETKIKERKQVQKIIIPNSSESAQTESTQTESTQTESTQTESTQTESPQTESTQSEYNTISQQGYPISCAPAWWRECNANRHKTTRGFNTQTGYYCWSCNDCNMKVGYEICNEHNTPATPEHMQLYLN